MSAPHISALRSTVDGPQVLLEASRYDGVVNGDVLLDPLGLRVATHDVKVGDAPDAIERCLVDAPSFEVPLDVLGDEAVPRNTTKATPGDLDVPPELSST